MNEVTFDILEYLKGTNPESSISTDELNFCYKMAMEHVEEKGIILELGVYHGRSACLFALVASIKEGHYYGIDYFQAPNLGGTGRAEVDRYLTERDLDSCSTIIVSATESYQWAKYVDCLHIDAEHIDPYVSQDIYKYAPWVIKEGIVILDDYSNPIYPDVRRAADKVFRNNPHWEEIGAVDDMICFKRL